jgi:hypothetical protein
MRRAPARTRATRGEISPASATPTATDAAALGYRKPPRSDHFGRTHLVCATWKAMSGSGSKIFGTTATKARRSTAPHGSMVVTRPTGSFEDGPGTTKRNSSATLVLVAQGGFFASLWATATGPPRPDHGPSRSRPIDDLSPKPSGLNQPATVDHFFCKLDGLLGCQRVS